MCEECSPEVNQVFLANPIPQSQGNRESVKILVIGSRQGVNKIVHRLHQLQFAEFNEWSRLLPAPVPGEVMRILIREIVVE
ncbi:hypothetical protein C7B76_27445 [filamentous cyanobacterium CCP2]|nr:hypothetical protein C7B76_27445 [filamentous cyanobacterium CCP2]